MKKVLQLLGVMCVSGGIAGASLIPVLSVGSPTAISGGFRYTYSVTLSSDERLDPVATNGVTCPGQSGVLVQCNPTGTFLTIYDFAGYIAGSATAPANFTVSTQLVGFTPSSVLPGDNPTVLNLTYRYTGPVVQGTNQVFLFTADSTIGLTALIPYAAQLTKSDPANPSASSNGTTDQNVGTVNGPAPSRVPEPASMALMGGGLLGLAGLLGRRTKKS